MTKELKKITILIPCRNEAEGIVRVLHALPHERARRAGFLLDPVVVDNNSTDHTASIACALGARVLREEEPGKGYAMRCGFANIPEDADYVVMIDGDGTYDAGEIMRLVEPLDCGFADVIIGSRLAGKIEHDAMSLLNRLGNWSFSFLVRTIYRANVTDVLTGYYAWSREAILDLRPHITVRDFGIEMDMVTKMARLGKRVYCVPIRYAARSGDSHLRPFADGMRILRVFLRNITWRPDREFGETRTDDRLMVAR